MKMDGAEGEELSWSSLKGAKTFRTVQIIVGYVPEQRTLLS